MRKSRVRRCLSKTPQVSALLGAWVLLAVTILSASPTAYADSSPVLKILTPAPSNSQAEGPVTTNVTIQAQGLTPGDTFQLGYAQQSGGGGCNTVFTAFPNFTTPVQSDGTFLTTFAWPADVNSV